MIFTFKGAEKYSEYIDACGDVLGIRDCVNEVTIDIKEKCDNDAGGFCHGDIDEVDIEIATHVQGEKLPEEDILRNITHEMIHAEQIITGRLENIGLQISGDGTLVNVVIWEGDTYTNTPYSEQPWELEAYSREETVMRESIAIVSR